MSLIQTPHLLVLQKGWWCRKPEGDTFSWSHRQEVALKSRACEAEGMPRRLTPLDYEDQAPSIPWGLALLVSSGQRGSWRSLPGSSNVTGLPPPQPCRGSRWPDCREGVGRSNRGRGMGEEAEKANGWGSGRGRGPAAGQAVV